MSLISTFIKDDSGITSIEYGMLGIFVAIAIVGGLTLLHGSVTALFNMVASSVPS